MTSGDFEAENSPRWVCKTVQTSIQVGANLVLKETGRF